MLFVKVVTDHGVKEQEGSPQDFKERIHAAGMQLCPYIEQLRALCEQEREVAAEHRAIREQASEDARILGEDLHCSVTMQAELRQLLFYCRLTGKDYAGIAEEYRRRG
jgi:hypothetical protein